MELNNYQDEAIEFARYTNREYPFLALSEEAGEVMGKVAKYVRKNEVSLPEALLEARLGNADELKEGLVLELGDVLWQLQACAYELGHSLDFIAKQNLYKLQGRDTRNTIVGSGDKR